MTANDIGATLHLTTEDAEALTNLLGRVRDETENDVLATIYNVLTEAGFTGDNFNTYTRDTETGDITLDADDEDVDKFLWVIEG